MSRPAATETLGMALGLVAVAVFAGSLPATRLAVVSLDANFVTAARAAIAGLIAAPVLVIDRRSPPWRDLPKLGLCALCLVGGFPGFTALALRALPAAHGGVVLGVLPLATAVVAALLDHDRPSPAFWLCSGLGGALVVGFALSRGGGALQAADALLLVAVACAAIGYTLSAQLSRRLSARQVISWVVVLALPISVPLSFAWRPADPGAVAPLVWASLAYLGAMSMYLGFFAWNAGLALGGVARVGQVQLVQPFLTFAIAAALLGERIDAETVICALVVFALVVAGRRTRVDVLRTAAAKG